MFLTLFFIALSYFNIRIIPYVTFKQNLMEKPQDLLMHMVENDFDYMETHLDITNSDSLWSNDHE